LTDRSSLTLWRFIKDRRDAHCILMVHPEGYEMRYVFNGVVLIGMVTRDQEPLLERAHQWRLRLVAEGWDEIEQNTTAMHSFVRGAARAAASGG
jgi:hypothetical protein